MKRILTLMALLGLGHPTPVSAQTAAVVEAFSGVERLTYRYRFENDSSLDTPFLVPHFFEQRYERTGTVFGARVSYPLFGRRAATSVQFVPDTRAFGSDFDTFFQPSGDRATSGTAGDVDLATWRLEHRMAVAEVRAVTIQLFAGYQRDRADFRPADRVVTHTLPPSETREFITDRERTVSHTVEFGLLGSIRAPLGRDWELEAQARLVPSIYARLLTQLPDKYPGRDIVFTAAGWSGGGRVTVARHSGRMTLGVWVAIEEAGSYRQREQFERNAVTAGGSLAFGSHR